MSNLITLENISLAFGLEPLLDQIRFQMTDGERVCLIGRNGAGKSSLLKIIEGVILPDSGTVWRKPLLRVSRLEQELPQSSELTVFEFVAQGLAETGALLAQYHHLTQSLTSHASAKEMNRLEQLQRQLDACDGWRFEQVIGAMLTRLELDPEQQVARLSGGWQRRAALAKALVVAPDLLLLDEPTNHLDVSAIEWLENQLLSAGCALLFITHDRALLQRLATRIIELDRGQLTSWPGDYDNFLRRKEEMLHAEAKLNADFDKKLAQEEVWIRQGIKARRTRNEGRVRALEAMRRERGQRRDVQAKASFNLAEGDKSGRLVVEAQHVSHAFQTKKVIDDFSIRIMRGDRIGLLGPNGVGKSTLLNILLGQMTPQHGTVTLGTNLQIAYFDQLRASLSPEKTVMENVAAGRDFIEVNDRKQHIISYLSDFLFTPARAMTPVKALSGGECNRLLLARLFSQPANLLVMDEPTNDLDIETLELLEDILSEFKGTLLLVSHDRQFVDNVVTSTLVFEGEGRIQEFVGGYHDWLRQRALPDASASASVKQKPKDDVNPQVKAATASKKLSYKEQRELAELPKKIETLEAEQQSLTARISDAEFYKGAADEVAKTLARLQQVEVEIADAYARWDALEG